MTDRKTYLGDGAYYDIRNGAVVLTTENGILTSNEVWLDPPVLAKLLSELGEDFDKTKLCAAINGAIR